MVPKFKGVNFRLMVWIAFTARANAGWFSEKSHGERLHLHLTYNIWYLFWLHSPRTRNKLLRNLIRWSKMEPPSHTARGTITETQKPRPTLTRSSCFKP